MTRRWISSCTILAVVASTFLSAASAVKHPGYGDMSGRVVDTEGAAIRDAIIFTRMRSLKSDDPFNRNIWYPTRSDAHGDFKLELLEGTYDVLVISPGFASEAQTAPLVEGKKGKLEFKLRPLDCSFPGVNCDTF
jgi:hypothetical protein